MTHPLLGIGGLGTGEIIIILVIILIVFGVGKLPEVGSGLGKGIRNFKKGMQDKEDEDKKDSSNQNPQ